VKKDCDKYADDLSALIDGELTPGWRAEIEAHLAGCADCRARVAQLRKVFAGIAAMPAAAPAPQFLAEVRRKIAGGEQPRVESRWEAAIRSPWVQLPVKIAAVVAVLIGLLSLLAPSFYSRVERKDRTKLAKAEKPRGAAAPARSDVATRSVASAPAPGRPTVATELNAPVATSGVEAPAQPLAFDRLEKENSEIAAEKMVLVSADPAEVRLRAAAVAVALNGRVLPASDEAAQSFRVELPSGQVAAFRNRLLAERESGTVEQKRLEDVGGARRAFVGGEATNEPVSVLEIQVVAPAK
jgi:anti-sigma factor RsiW